MYYPLGDFFVMYHYHTTLTINSILFLTLYCNPQSPEWNVRQVLSIQGFFMSSPLLHHSDNKSQPHTLTQNLSAICPIQFM